MLETCGARADSDDEAQRGVRCRAPRTGMMMVYKLVRYPLSSGAMRAMRLSDMKGSILDVEHQGWLDIIINEFGTAKYIDLRIDIVGFSSTKGSGSANTKLSNERAEAVSNYIFLKKPWLAATVGRCEGFGEMKSDEFGRDPANEDDDDYLWRSVIVQVFANLKPVPQPANPDDVPSAYAGASRKWSMAALPSFSYTPIGAASVGGGFYLFRQDDQSRKLGLYGAGLFGFDLSPRSIMKKLDALRGAGTKDESVRQVTAFLWEVFSVVATSGVDALVEKLSNDYKLQPVKAINKFRHKDLNGATLTINDMPLGLKSISVHGKLPTFNNRGKVVIHKDEPFFESVSMGLKLNTDLGTNWSLTGGPLLRLD